MLSKDDLLKLKQSDSGDEQLELLAEIANALNNSSNKEIVKSVTDLSDSIYGLRKVDSDNLIKLSESIKEVQAKSDERNEEQTNSLIKLISDLIEEVSNYNDEIASKLESIFDIKETITLLKDQMKKNEEAEWEFSLERNLSTKELEKVTVKRIK